MCISLRSRFCHSLMQLLRKHQQEKLGRYFRETFYLIVLLIQLTVTFCYSLLIDWDGEFISGLIFFCFLFHQCETKHYALAKSCLLIWECPLRSFTAVHNFVRYWILNMMCGGFNCSKNTLVVLNIIYIVSDVAVSFVTVTLVKYTPQLCVRFLGVNYMACVWQIFCAQSVTWLIGTPGVMSFVFHGLGCFCQNTCSCQGWRLVSSAIKPSGHYSDCQIVDFVSLWSYSKLAVYIVTCIFL